MERVAWFLYMRNVSECEFMLSLQRPFLFVQEFHLHIVSVEHAMGRVLNGFTSFHLHTHQLDPHDPNSSFRRRVRV